MQQQQNSTLDITISNCVFSAELDSRMFAYLYLVFLYYKNLSQFIIKNMKDESIWEVILNEVFYYCTNSNTHYLFLQMYAKHVFVYVCACIYT